MKSEFKRTNNGLELVIIPESGQDRTMMDELVNDRHNNIFLRSQFHIRTERRGESRSIANLSIRRNVNIVPNILIRYGFEFLSGGYILDIPCCLYYRRMVRFTYIIFGQGIYAVFKTTNYFDGASLKNGILTLYNGIDVVEHLHKRKNRIAVIGTLQELEIVLNQK